jgi:tripeptidyl-peptidase-1
VFIGALVLGALALAEPRTVLEALKPSARAMQASNRYGTWALGGKVEDHEKAKLIFALKQQNLKELEDLWYKVSTPGSDKFGQFLSRKQVSALVAPTEESVRDVLRWLETRGHHVKATHQNDFIIVETTIAEASDILGAPFHWFTNMVTKQRFARIIGDYSLPSTIASTLTKAQIFVLPIYLRLF